MQFIIKSLIQLLRQDFYAQDITINSISVLIIALFLHKELVKFQSVNFYNFLKRFIIYG